MRWQYKTQLTALLIATSLLSVDQCESNGGGAKSVADTRTESQDVSRRTTAEGCPKLALPDPIIMVYGFTINRPKWAEHLELLTLVEGPEVAIAKNPDFAELLQKKKKLFAVHVTIDQTKSDDEAYLYDLMARPFEQTFDGRQPCGFAAIEVDEIRLNQRDGSAGGQALIKALRRVRHDYPEKIIIVSGAHSVVENAKQFKELFAVINENADLYIQETYLKTTQTDYRVFREDMSAIENVAADLADKTIFALSIAERGSSSVNLSGESTAFITHLERQLEQLPPLSENRDVRGVAFWVYYRSNDITVDAILKRAHELFDEK